MIKEINDVPIRKSGVIYDSSLKQIKKLFLKDPQKAGELAIMIIELTLTGQHSSDDDDLDIAITTTEAITKHDRQKYENVIESKKQKQIQELQLDVIAEMYNNGYTQVKIAEALGVTKQVVGYRLNTIIRVKYPELLEESKSQTSKKVKNLTNSSKINEVKNLTESKSQKKEFVENLDESKSQKSQKSKILTEFTENQTDGLDESKILTKNSGQKVKQVKHNDNVNDNDNVNVSPVSSNEETLESINLSEINRMGAVYKMVGNDIVEFSTGKRMKVIMDF